MIGNPTTDDPMIENIARRGGLFDRQAANNVMFGNRGMITRTIPPALGFCAY